MSVLPARGPDKFYVGQWVKKVTGDYTFVGDVRAIIVKRSGVIRYAVEDDRGILHIFNGSQLEGTEKPNG